MYGTRILGPNTIMGVLNTANGLNTTFEIDLMPERGNIAVVSQSGGVGACLLDWACFFNIGISKFAFVGDKIDVNDVDLLRYLGKDRKTKVICLYMEGVKNGRELILEARKIVKRKPILVLKGGVTCESAHRAKSHTASVAGSNEVFDAAFKKAGMIRAENIEELMDMAIALSKQPPMLGDNVAIVSNVGGPSILAADAVERNGLKLAQLSSATKKEIESQYLGVDASNPIDLIADAKAERYKKVLELVLADKKVDGVLVINMLKSTFFEPSDSRVIPRIASRFPRKPVVDVPAGGEDFAKVYEVLGRSSVPLYNLPEKAARALRVLRAYGVIREIKG
jgi:acetyltransferase